MSQNKNIFLDNITVRVPGKTLIKDCDLSINFGTKYGLVGINGIGKSTLLQQINDKTLPIDPSIDVFYVNQELEFDGNKTIYQIVLDANRKRTKLMAKLQEIEKGLEGSENDENGEIDEDTYNKLLEQHETVLRQLQDLDYKKDDSIIRRILHGLGFDSAAQNTKFSQFSGGWKMRVSLARGLYMKPTLLLLDEPTNHLDLNAVIWLTDYLCNEWKKTLIVVSHDTYFLNEVCNYMIHINDQKLSYFKGNYDNYKKAAKQIEKEREKEWAKIENKVKEMRQKHTPKKDVTKFLQDNAKFEPKKMYRVRINFPEVTGIKWPSLSVSDGSFGYNRCGGKNEGKNEGEEEDEEESELILQNINLSLCKNEKITLVGKNGVGKSTLLQIVEGSLKLTDGEYSKDSRVRIGFYNQHTSNVLPGDLNAVAFLQSVNKELKEDEARKILGSTNLAGEHHLQLISTLSGGQKARIVIASLIAMRPHILLLDEPTNHLDLETIEGLIKAINNFEGSVIIITHNIDVIQKTNSILYEVKEKTLVPTDFDTYYEGVLEEINQIN